MLSPLKKITMALLLAAPIVAWAGEGCDSVVAVVATAQPPYLWQPEGEGKPAGAYVELLDLLAKDLEIEVKLLTVASAAVAEAEVASGRADILLAGTVSQSGLTQFDYFYPAVTELEQVAWVRADQAHEYRGWNDLRGKRGILLAGQAPKGSFADFAQANLTFEVAPSFEQALVLLQNNQADFVVHERLSGGAQLAVNDRASQLRAVEWPLFTESLHLALSHNSACNESGLRGQLAARLYQYAADGVLQRLQREHLQKWSAELADGEE